MNFVKFKIDDMREDGYVLVNLDNVIKIRQYNLSYEVCFENSSVLILNNEENNRLLSDLIINEDLKQIKGQLEIGDFYMKKVYLVYKLSDAGVLKVDKIFSKLLTAKKYVSEERLKGGFYHFEEMEIEE